MLDIRRALVLVAVTGALFAGAMAIWTGTARADTENWDAIAQCESGGNWATDSGNGHYGGLQFSPATWAANGGVGSPATASRSEQIRVAENVKAHQGMAAWPKCGAPGGSPAVWGAPGQTGCQALPAGVFTVVDFQRMCTALTNPGRTLLAALPIR